MKSSDNTPSNDDDSHKTEIKKDTVRTSAAFSTSETVSRFGSANAEYIKGYTGVDNEKNIHFMKSLRGIAKGKIHPDYVKQSIKQQAGYSAEVATTSRDNAEAIISKSKIRTVRSDDLLFQYGSNHPVVDRVQILNGKLIEFELVLDADLGPGNVVNFLYGEVVEGSESQMKFVGDRDKLLNDIAREDGKFARYRGIKLELPSEQYEGAAQHCRE